MNQHLRTLIVAPMTTAGRAYPWRIACRLQKRMGFVALDQVHAVDTERIAKRLGRINPNTLFSVLTVLQEMFSP